MQAQEQAADRVRADVTRARGAHRSRNIGCRCNGACIGRSRTGRGARRASARAPSGARAHGRSERSSPRAANHATRVPRGTPSEPVAAPAATGIVNIAVSPWGQVEVDGRDAGTTPPLSQLVLSEGTHSITIRNADFPPHTVKITVNGAQPVTLRHRF